MKKFFKTLGKIIAGILILALLLVIALSVIPLTEKVPTSPAADAGDWMAALPDDRVISEITMPGTHDCASMNAQLGFITKCQALDVAQQLNIGARYLDIRLGAVDGALKLYHGFTKCKASPLPWAAQIDLEDVLRDCYAFLDAHPGETILFAVKQEHGGLSDAEFDALVQSYVQRDAERWLTPDALPTLGEARDKLVLLRRYEGAGLRRIEPCAEGVPLVFGAVFIAVLHPERITAVVLLGDVPARVIVPALVCPEQRQTGALIAPQ